MPRKSIEPKITYVNQPNMQKIMDVMAELLSKQLGYDITIKATLKEEYGGPKMEAAPTGETVA